MAVGGKRGSWGTSQGITPSPAPTRARSEPRPRPTPAKSPEKPVRTAPREGRPAGEAKRLVIGAGALIATVVGYVLHHHFEVVRHLCQSRLGVFGQQLSIEARKGCNYDSGLADLGLFLIIVGSVTLAGCVVGLTIARGRTDAERWTNSKTARRS